MSDMNNAQLRRLDASLLLVFDEVLRTGNLTRASERLNLTPSAISHALSRLRDIFGDPLFLRRAQGVVATPRARLLREPVARALAAMRAALTTASEFRPAAIDRLFQIASLDAAVVNRAPALLARLAREAPNARIAFRTFGREETLEGLRESRLDLALGVFDSTGPDMVRRPLGSESFAVVARVDHPRLRDGLTLEDWLACDHILVSAAGDLIGAVDAALAARGLRRRTSAAMPQFLAAFATVAASDRDGDGSRGAGAKLRRPVRAGRPPAADRAGPVRTGDSARQERGARSGAGLARRGARRERRAGAVRRPAKCPNLFST